MLGSEISPRGMRTREMITATILIPPYPFQAYEERELNLDYLRREFQWYLIGDRHDLRIADHAKIWSDHVNNDSTLNSNYGHYLVRERGLLTMSNILRKDKHSRQAVWNIYDAKKHNNWATNDIPCTCTMSFLIRDNRLTMHIHMRSNDLVFGLGNDAPCFHWFHQIMYWLLKDTYPELEFGNYVHTANSLHIYERHFDLARKIRDGSATWNPVGIPVIGSLEEAVRLIGGERCSGEFSRWLYEVEL
jgi:thymidylate synthase